MTKICVELPDTALDEAFLRTANGLDEFFGGAGGLTAQREGNFVLLHIPSTDDGQYDRVDKVAKRLYEDYPVSIHDLRVLKNPHL